MATLDGVVREGLSEEVAFELRRLPRVRVKSWPRQRDQQHHSPKTSKSLTYVRSRKEVRAARARGELEMTGMGSRQAVLGCWSLF